MIGYIYSLHRETESDIFYIGATISPLKRQSSHKSNFKHSLTLSVIEEIEIDNLKELRPIESYWVQQFRTWGFKLVNRELFYGFNLYHRIELMEIDKEFEIARN